jgi:hypothetical protein
MASHYVLASSEYGEISLKEEIEKTFIFHVSKNNNKFIYFIVNPTEEIQELVSGLEPRGGHFNHRHFFSDLSPSEIKGKMFSGILSWDVSGSGYNPFPVIAIPYTIKKLLLEREWEYDYDSYTDKAPSKKFNYGYTYKKMKIEFKNTYLVIPHFTGIMTPIDRTTSNWKRFEILELTKQYAIVLLTYETNHNGPCAKPFIEVEGTFTWHISGPTLLPPPPIPDTEPVFGDLLLY